MQANIRRERIHPVVLRGFSSWLFCAANKINSDYMASSIKQENSRLVTFLAGYVIIITQ